ncbi:MAG TPA: hypothetical protein VM390_05845 [Acidimicrobiales bacterium]|nr:hypothetical protein [Acidimicrobiales bacterium]
MRARSIVALVVAGVVLLAVGTMAGRGTTAGSDQDPDQAKVGPPRGIAVATTSAPAEAGPSSTGTSSTPGRLPAPWSTSSTTAPFAQGRQLTDRLEREQPLAGALPHQTPHYAIDYRVVDGRLELSIRLFAVLNDADQLAQYEGQLRRYKAEALDFIRAQGQDPAAYRILYRPPEAAAL